jgi:hypothetical protein
MMRLVKIEILETDNVVIPGVGQVAGEVEYYPEFHGTYWDPPEPLEIADCDLRVIGEGDISKLFDSEDAVIALEGAVSALGAKQDAEVDRYIESELPF